MSVQVLRGASTSPNPKEVAQPVETNEYTELKRLIKNKGLLGKQPLYYAYKIPLTLGLLALSLAFLSIVDSLWLQLLNAALMAFALAQIGFIGHDLGHRQVFHSTRRNDIAGLVVCLLIGVDRTWWVDKHNEHHSNPNDLDLDPDIDIPVIAFSEEQARSKRGLARLIVKYQSRFFYPLLCLEALGLRLASIQYLLRTKVKYPVAEPLLMAAHIVLYFGLVFYPLSAWHAVLFIIVHQALFGLYMGSVFAPNHKGMLIVRKGSQLDFLRRQVLTARNVKSQPFTDFLYGGLNYQIEHHLFPSMPRNKLKEAQKIVKDFCQTQSISYHETSILQSQREILQYLHHVSAPLRGDSA